MDKIYSKIKGRIVQFIEFKNITKEIFFHKTGIASSNFKGNNSKSELGGDKIAKILTEFPELYSLVISKPNLIQKMTVSYPTATKSFFHFVPK